MAKSTVSTPLSFAHPPESAIAPAAPLDYNGHMATLPRPAGNTAPLLALAALLLLPRPAPAAPWPWQEPQARVLPTGDLEWTPHPFEFQTAGPPAYIDFAAGDDTADGLSHETAWKHHPWDPQATARAAACRGPHTYVFKQGVTYRGELNATESGTTQSPIILTRDPSWGTGPAVICGSEAVTGWTRGADHPLIPEPDKVWRVDLGWAPRNLWMVAGDGGVIRVPLARTPNWIISDEDDIKSQWWTWKNADRPFDNYATINGGKRHLAFDPDDINESHPQEYYEGAVLWTTKGWVMGNPFPARVLAVDRQKGSLVFPGQWGGEPSYKIIRGCNFYLEDKPQYLDSPGEFWFDRHGKGGRLYLRLPGDRDPNTTRVEVARRIHGLESRGMSNVRVRGLAFRFNNVYWNITAAPYWVSHESLDVQPACVRLLGSGTNLEVSHCVFEHTHKAVRFRAMEPPDRIDRVVISDNLVSDADSGGVELGDGTTYGDLDAPMGRLYDVRVLRNKFDHIGLRPDLFSQGAAVAVDYAETAEVAGNFCDRIAAQGIDIHGAKASDAATDRPFTRLLIHHNKAVDTLVNVDDFGGIETWEGGPAYVYDNLSGNPGGYRSWEHALSPGRENRFGHAYYLDGAFKNYYFNNIAWGKSKGPGGRLANTSAFQEIISYENSFFNNTIYNFVRGSRRQAPEAGRVKFLGNIWDSLGERVFRDSDPANTEAAGNEADAGPRKSEFAMETDAYARNVFHDTGAGFGVFEPSGRWHKTLDSFRDALGARHPLASEVGVFAQESPLRDPANHDFRPSDDPATRGRGARVFVPWALYETVGEWHFLPLPGEPERILDEHWCMSPYYTSRDDYHKLPNYPLHGVNITLADYTTGPLENWTKGALRFNGRDQYAVLANTEINRPVKLNAGRGKESHNRTVTGPEISSPQIARSSFLLEICFQATPGAHDGTLIRKRGTDGWSLELNGTGGVTFETAAGGVHHSLASRVPVNDGRWHHVIAEADRPAARLAIYLDGHPDATGTGPGTNVSLANDADLYVGGTPGGRGLAGSIDFLRLARGTLADARTTIEELHAWEFHGPFLEDFTGRPRPEDGGEAGAILAAAPGTAAAPAGTVYVVDQSAPGAADTNPGTETRPFFTVQRAADAARPGDTIYVMAGRYDERVKARHGGEPRRPVSFISAPRHAARVAGFDLAADHLRVEGFEVTADPPATAFQLTACDCEVLENDIHHMMIGVNGTSGRIDPAGNVRDYAAVSRNRVARNRVFHSEYGFVLGGNDWLVEDNEVDRLFMYAPGRDFDDCDYTRFFGRGCVQRRNYYHGSIREEIKTAHVDCLQTFCNNGEMAADLLFEENACFDFHQMCMVESKPHLGHVRNWTFRGNIAAPNSPALRGGWGPDIIQTPDVTIEHCTFSSVNWSTIGLRGRESLGGIIRDNLLCDAERALIDGDSDFTASKPVVEYNVTFHTAPLGQASNRNGGDPLFVDGPRRNFRLRAGSAAIGAAREGGTAGALAYPNVYYVDPQHPSATDEPGWGYPAVPLATLARACALAQPGETIILRGGVYREALPPARAGVTIRAQPGEQVILCRSDRVESWRREADGSWSAPLPAGATGLRRDGAAQPWPPSARGTGRLLQPAGADPRLHLLEADVRATPTSLADRKDILPRGITIADTGAGAPPR